MLFFCPKCDAIVEHVGATRSSTVVCQECGADMEPAFDEDRPAADLTAAAAA